MGRVWVIGQDGLANQFRALGLGPEARSSSSQSMPASGGLLPTDEYTVLSHAHGRQRRVERGIDKLVRNAAWCPHHCSVHCTGAEKCCGVPSGVESRHQIRAQGAS